jgi:UDP-N-acetylmuramate--alanine ligase
MNQASLPQPDLRDFRQVYFLGIGGIGMSALARWFVRNGLPVSGYDRTPGPLTEALQKEGMAIHFEDNTEAIPDAVRNDKEHTLVVLTPAIPAKHTEWNYFRESGYTILKRSQVLGLLSRNSYTVAVAGTHGKTTTSSMIAWLLREAGLGCTAFLGGITANYGTNFLLSEKAPENSVMVVEADEFDRSFLTLFPNLAVVTSLDPDHLDIYGDSETMTRAYSDFILQIKREGTLLLQSRVAGEYETRSQVSTIRYGLDKGDWYARNAEPNGFGFDFELFQGLNSFGKFHLAMPGYHNVENAVAALLVGHRMGIDWETLRRLLPGFRGVRRRFEKIEGTGNRILIDDYAHHPSEIEAALRSIRALYPDKKLGVVFQPHLYSRTRDFALEFSHALNEADTLWLLDIYPARELPISGVSSKLIFDRVDSSRKSIVSKENLIPEILESDCEVIAMLGAGDIDRLVAPLAEALNGSTLNQKSA